MLKICLAAGKLKTDTILDKLNHSSINRSWIEVTFKKLYVILKTTTQTHI